MRSLTCGRPTTRAITIIRASGFGAPGVPVRANAEGRYRFRTIVPAAYEGRTRHFHVKVAPQGGRLLTTQLYFPGEPKNAKDGLYRKELLIRTAKDEGSLAGRFDFVLDMR